MRFEQFGMSEDFLFFGKYPKCVTFVELVEKNTQNTTIKMLREVGRVAAVFDSGTSFAGSTFNEAIFHDTYKLTSLTQIPALQLCGVKNKNLLRYVKL